MGRWIACLLVGALVLASPAAAQPWMVRDAEIAVAVDPGDTIQFAALVFDDTSLPRGFFPPSGDTRIPLLVRGRSIACAVEYIIGPRPDGGSQHVFRFDVQLWQLGNNRLSVEAVVVDSAGAVRLVAAERSFTLDASDHLFTAFGRARASAEIGGRFVETTVIGTRALSPWVENCQATFCKDADRDGLLDLWEQLVTAALQPHLVLDEEDGLRSDPRAALADLVRTTPTFVGGVPSNIVLQHTAAFSRDYGGTFGFDSHFGDGEDFQIVLGIERDRVVVRHLQTDGHIGFGERGDFFSFPDGPASLFMVFDEVGRPLVWVEEDKHGTWPNARACDVLGFYDCDGEAPGDIFAAPALNVGEVEHAFIDSFADDPTLASEFDVDPLCREAVYSETRFCGGDLQCLVGCGGGGFGCDGCTGPLSQFLAAADPAPFLHRSAVLCGAGWTLTHCPFGARPETPEESFDIRTTDADHDLYEDACDRCPGSEDGPHLDDPDRDGDRILDGCDPCPRRDSGRDCNLDAERVGGFVPVDDICDSTPCGDTQVRSDTVRIAGGGSQTFTRLDVDAVSAVRQPARTGVRACWCTDATGNTTDDRDACVSVSPDGSGGCGIGEPFVPNYGAVESIDNRWWRASVTWSSDVALASSDEAALDYSATAGRFVPDTIATWRMDEDLPRWSSIIDTDLAALYPDAVPLVTWTHAPGPPPFRGAVPSFPPGVRAVSSHYTSGPTPRPRGLAFEAPTAGLVIDATLPRFPACRFCPDDCPWCGAAFPGAWLLVNDAGVIADAQGWVRDATADFDAATFDVVRDLRDSKWVSASEADDQLVGEGLRWASLTQDGSLALSVVAATRGGHTDVAFLPPGYFLPPQQPGDPAPFPPPQPFAASMIDQVSPSPRRDFGAALSATRFRLWVVGGASLDTGLPLQDVWALDVLAGRWTYLELVGDDRPERVLAVGYSAARDVLYVLDHAADDLRLLRIDPLGGDVRRVATWRAGYLDERWAIGVDGSGAVYVASSAGGESAHRLVRLDPDDGSFLGWTRGPGRLASPDVRASERGASILVQRDGHLAEPLGYRYDDLAAPRGRVPWP